MWCWRLGFCGLICFRPRGCSGVACLSHPVVVDGAPAPCTACTLISALVSQIVFAGMMLSSAIWGKLCDKYGRKVVSTQVQCTGACVTVVSTSELSQTSAVSVFPCDSSLIRAQDNHRTSLEWNRFTAVHRRPQKLCTTKAVSGLTMEN